MKEKRIYGVVGMLEWHPVLRVGRSAMRVRFEGGALSGYGVSPATFSTSNKAVQCIIENSAEFKSGKIQLLRRVKSDNVESKGETENISEATSETDSAQTRVVKVKTLQDAANYLKESEGVAEENLMTADDILASALQIGISFKGCKQLEDAFKGI